MADMVWERTNIQRARPGSIVRLANGAEKTVAFSDKMTDGDEEKLRLTFTDGTTTDFGPGSSSGFTHSRRGFTVVEAADPFGRMPGQAGYTHPLGAAGLERDREDQRRETQRIAQKEAAAIERERSGENGNGGGGGPSGTRSDIDFTRFDGGRMPPRSPNPDMDPEGRIRADLIIEFNRQIARRNMIAGKAGVDKSGNQIRVQPNFENGKTEFQRFLERFAGEMIQLGSRPERVAEIIHAKVSHLSGAQLEQIVRGAEGWSGDPIHLWTPEPEEIADGGGGGGAGGAILVDEPGGAGNVEDFPVNGAPGGGNGAPGGDPSGPGIEELTPELIRQLGLSTTGGGREDLFREQISGQGFTARERAAAERGFDQFSDIFGMQRDLGELGTRDEANFLDFLGPDASDLPSRRPMGMADTIGRFGDWLGGEMPTSQNPQELAAFLRRTSPSQKASGELFNLGFRNLDRTRQNPFSTSAAAKAHLGRRFDRTSIANAIAQAFGGEGGNPFQDFSAGFEQGGGMGFAGIGSGDYTRRLQQLAGILDTDAFDQSTPEGLAMQTLQDQFKDQAEQLRLVTLHRMQTVNPLFRNAVGRGAQAALDRFNRSNRGLAGSSNFLEWFLQNVDDEGVARLSQQQGQLTGGPGSTRWVPTTLPSRLPGTADLSARGNQFDSTDWMFPQ